MSLLTVLIVIAFVIIAVILISNFVGDAKLQRILYAVVAIVVIIWIVKASGLLSYLASVKV